MRLFGKLLGGAFAPTVHREMQSSMKQPSLDLLEGRVMRTDSVAQETVYNSGQISQMPASALFAHVLAGDNGDVWGVPTVVVGSSPENWSAAYQTWDSNTQNGFDSSVQTVELVADFQSDTISWSLDQGETAQFAGTDCDSVTSVTVRAGVRGAGMSVQWSQVNIQFFSNGELAASATADGPGVSTGENTAKESITTFTPSGTGYDKVVVRGNVRMQAASGVYVWGDDLFGEILINC